jgi:hypothetical protein
MGGPAADRWLIAAALARARDSTSALASGDWFNGTTKAHRQEASLKRPTGNGRHLPCFAGLLRIYSSSIVDAECDPREGATLCEDFRSLRGPHHFRRILNGLALETGKSYDRAMAQMQSKNMSQPDEKRSFDKGELELITLGGVTSQAGGEGSHSTASVGNKRCRSLLEE